MALRTRMCREFHPWGATNVPKIGIRFERKGLRSPVFQALVDSGAALTIANRVIAKTIHLTDDDFLAADPIELVGAGGRRFYARRFQLEIQVGVGGGQPFSLPSSTVCFTEDPLPYPVLLGQRDFLEQLVYVQRNQLPQPEFVLDRPRAARRPIPVSIQ